MSKNMQGKVIKYFRSDESTFLKKVKKHGEDVKNSCADNNPGTQKN